MTPKRMTDQEKPLLIQSEKQLVLADHLLTMTYPLVKDPKLLVGVIQSLHRSYDLLIQNVLHQTSIQQKILRTKTFANRFAQFKIILKNNKNINEKELQSIQTIHDLLEEHNKSPVEFSRGQKFVICSDDYSFETLTPEKLKIHLHHAKKLLKTLKTTM
jgi:hypothetical protein